MTDITQTEHYQHDMQIERDPAAREKLWFFSFADGALPPGSQFLGGLYIRAKSLSGAIRASHVRGLNPGGEVQFIELPPAAAAMVTEEWIGRLLTREELAAHDAAMESSPS